jgi:hypothetical protein
MILANSTEQRLHYMRRQTYMYSWVKPGEQHVYQRCFQSSHALLLPMQCSNLKPPSHILQGLQ